MTLLRGKGRQDRHPLSLSLLQEKGVDIYRMKGVLAMAGCEERYVYQVSIKYTELKTAYSSSDVKTPCENMNC